MLRFKDCEKEGGCRICRFRVLLEVKMGGKKLDFYSHARAHTHTKMIYEVKRTNRLSGKEVNDRRKKTEHAYMWERGEVGRKRGQGKMTEPDG